MNLKQLVDGKDTIVGADVEIAKAIAEELGVDVKFSSMSLITFLRVFNLAKQTLPSQEFQQQKNVRKLMIFRTLTMRLKMLSSSKNRTRQPIPHLKVWQEKQLVRKKVQSKKTLRKTNCQIRASFP